MYVIRYDRLRGYIYVGGSFSDAGWQTRRGIFRLHANGAVDTSFAPLGYSDGGSVYDLWIQPDGKVVMAGSFSKYNGTIRYLARLNLDGSFDSSFTPPNLRDAYTVLGQDNGKLLVGGSFTTGAGAPRNHLLRLNANGSHDTSFVDPQLNGSVYRLRASSGGRVMVTGSFDRVHGVDQTRVARLMPNGQRDASFRNPAINTRNASVSDIVPHPKRGWLIGGGFSAVGGQLRDNFARLKPDGTVDSRGRTDFDSFIKQFLPLGSHQVLAVGAFTRVAGIARVGVAVLDFDDGEIFSDGFERDQ